MAEAVEAAWGPCEGLVLTRHGYGRATQGIEIVEAEHPVPDARGLETTARMLHLLEDLGPDDFVLALISGGGSALFVQPAGAITLAEKQAVNDALLASGAPIGEMNIVRKHLSRVIRAGQAAAASWPPLCLRSLSRTCPATIRRSSPPDRRSARPRCPAMPAPSSITGRLPCSLR